MGRVVTLNSSKKREVPVTEHLIGFPINCPGMGHPGPIGCSCLRILPHDPMSERVAAF